MTATALSEMTGTTTRTWNLDQAEIPATIAKLQKINDRAVMKGLASLLTWSLGEEVRTPRYHQDAYGVITDTEPAYYTVTREFTVEGAAPKLNGWSFLATLSWETGVLVTRTVEGFEGRIDASVIRERWCDHCQTERGRIDTYLVEHEDGRRVQVGSSCVKDFLGHEFSPAWLRAADELDEMERNFGSGGWEGVEPVTVLTWAASITEKSGWVSVAKAEIEGRAASSGTLKAAIFGQDKHRKPGDGCASCLRAEYQPTDEHKAQAEVVLAWARAIDPGTPSEYLANVRRLIDAEIITVHNTGILGSAVASWWREQNEKIERAARPVSNFLGEVKSKVTVRTTVKGHTPIEGYYGTTHLYTMITMDGDVVKWFSSRNVGLELGTDIEITGTVKNHEIWKDTRQTVVTRCKFAALAAV